MASELALTQTRCSILLHAREWLLSCCQASIAFALLQEELKDFFPTLLDFAGALTSAAPEPARKAGAAMFVALFLQFESSYHRQVKHATRRADLVRTFIHPFFQANAHFCAVIRPDCLLSVSAQYSL